MIQPPAITQMEFEDADHDRAEKMAQALGYGQYAYTSTSALWGLFCLPESPKHHPDMPHRGGCIIKTAEFGLLFVQDEEDIGIEAETLAEAKHARLMAEADEIGHEDLEAAADMLDQLRKDQR